MFIRQTDCCSVTYTDIAYFLQENCMFLVILIHTCEIMCPITEAHLPDTTECQRHRNQVLRDNLQSYQPGQYVPQCDEDGDYKELQCYTSTGTCWCVNKNGEEIDGTRTPNGNGQPDCLGKSMP